MTSRGEYNMAAAHQALHNAFQLLILISSIILFGLSAAQAEVITPELKAALDVLATDDKLPVIVTFSRKASLDGIQDKQRKRRRARIIRALKEDADLTQAEVTALLKRRRAEGIKRLWLINGLAATLKVDIIRELARYRRVEKISLDRIVPLSVPFAAPAGPAEWNIEAIQARPLWELGYTGEQVVVAGMDSGVDLDHPDLKDRWRGGSNGWFDPNGEHPDRPYDSDGHGTQTMGIVLGGNDGGTSIGVAPGATWIAVKIFDDSGTATWSGIHAGFQWILDPDGDPDTDDAPDVLNSSWGLVGTADQCVNEFLPDIQALKTAGISVVFPAGNEGPAPGTSLSPANNGAAISVGAVDEFSTVALFSSRGPSACHTDAYPDIVAPGVGIYTSDLSFGGLADRYVTVSGTSFSAAHMSGAVALLWSAFPGLGAQALEDALRGSAIDVNNDGPDDEYGYGLIDVKAAYDVLVRQGAQPCTLRVEALRASPYPAVAGEEITFQSVVSGGAAPLTYAWDVDGDGAIDYDTPEPVHTYPSCYDGIVELTVTDAQGCISRVQYVPFSPFSVGITADPRPADLGDAVIFTSLPSGGVPPYSYTWDVDGDGVTDCGTPDCTHVFVAPYDGAVQLLIEDSAGCSASALLTNVTVTSTSAPAPASGPEPAPAAEAADGGGGGGGGGGCFIVTMTPGAIP